MGFISSYSFWSFWIWFDIGVNYSIATRKKKDSELEIHVTLICAKLCQNFRALQKKKKTNLIELNFMRKKKLTESKCRTAKREKKFIKFCVYASILRNVDE